MISPAFFVRNAAGWLMLLLLSLALSACGGGGGTTTAGGGTGGTGLTTGSVTGFGSVKLNGGEFFTDNTTIKTVDDVQSDLPDNETFREGMIVAVRHGADDDNAVEIDFDANVRGSIESIRAADNVIVILGQESIVDGATRFDPPDLTFVQLGVGEFIEISGFADESGRLRASFIAREDPGEWRMLGFVHELSPANGTFRLGPLPPIPGIPAVTVITVDFAGAELRDPPLANGKFVKVRTDVAPSQGVLIARRIDSETYPFAASDGTRVSFEGFPANLGVAGPGTFHLNGVRVSTSGAIFVNGSSGDINIARKLQADGTMTGGVLAATTITFK